MKAVQQVLQVLTVKVETCYDLGWKLSLYDTLHGMWQDQVKLRSGNGWVNSLRIISLQ